MQGQGPSSEPEPLVARFAGNVTFVEATTSSNPVIAESAKFLLAHAKGGGWAAVKSSRYCVAELLGHEYYLSTVDLPVGQSNMVSTTAAPVFVLCMDVCAYRHAGSNG